MKWKGYLSLLFVLRAVSFYAVDYVVQPGDTLLGISRKIGIPVAAIRRINELTSDTLRVGQKLAIPDELQEYTVQSGDTLIALSRRFSTPLPSIILCNQLPDENLYTGQKLLIPIFKNNPSSSNSFSPSHSSENPASLKKQQTLWHTVRSGETLYSIAKLYNVKTTDIQQWNTKNSPTIYPGEKLRIYTTTGEKHPPPKPPTNQHLAWSGDFPVDRKLILSLENTPRGVRVQVKENTVLRATTTGVVEYTGWLYGFGNVVIVSLGQEKRIVFGELDTITVRKGQKLSSETIIASIQKNSFFYLEIRDGTMVLNPLKWYGLSVAQKNLEKEKKNPL
ncbi:LysM peptidoglycan-binding domain-containing protein [Thermospira aquatica]|uniref:LysM peptidoglycan-binding domain-containing protein n=1 Tax=Thermospira aquatica TaxID=2828656 RepID=A0AAX3BBG0_9SPIR|nr:LysM peptidoglycan-binding domain-containing protein [Thermospira aquatica]URA09369.1 LysM peptidoglycan-binding domain-containing protein [Thermospira aquatica]